MTITTETTTCTLEIGGMTCASCVMRIEKALKAHWEKQNLRVLLRR